jgi:adenine-specific DNA-methyltransferase
LIKDPASSSLIHPLLTGDDLCRWGAEFNERYLIFTNGGIDIEKFPAIHSYLQQFKTKLQPKPLDWVPTEDLKKWPGRKSGSYAWYELQDTVEYSEKFLLQKIIYPEFSQGPKFTFDLDGRFLTNKCFMIQGTWADLAVLNSRPIWYLRRQPAA